MTFLLQRIDAVPLEGNDLTNELNRWLATLADSLNTAFDQIEALVLFPVAVTDTTQQALEDETYIILNPAQTTVTLPAIASVGARVAIVGTGAAGWILLANVGQTINVANNVNKISVTSAERYDTIEVICTVANTTWVGLNSETTGFTYA